MWAVGCAAPWVKAVFPCPAHQQCSGLQWCLAPPGASLCPRFPVARCLRGASPFPLPARVFVLQARRIIGDFGIPISILVMVLVDYTITDTYTQVGASAALRAPPAAQQRSLWRCGLLSCNAGFVFPASLVITAQSKPRCSPRPHSHAEGKHQGSC